MKSTDVRNHPSILFVDSIQTIGYATNTMEYIRLLSSCFAHHPSKQYQTSLVNFVISAMSIFCPIFPILDNAGMSSLLQKDGLPFSVLTSRNDLKHQ